MRYNDNMLSKVTNDGFDAVYKIMEESFPQNEIRSFYGQQALLGNADYSLFVLRENGQTLGFIAVWELCDFVFVEHFAISEKHRGRGLGTAMLSEIKSMFSVPLVLEVEPPVDTKTRKRIAFYEHNGFVYHDFYYVQPAMEEGREEVELKVMSTQKLDMNGFEKVRNVLYKSIYNVQI